MKPWVYNWSSLLVFKDRKQTQVEHRWDRHRADTGGQVFKIILRMTILGIRGTHPYTSHIVWESWTARLSKGLSWEFYKLISRNTCKVTVRNDYDDILCYWKWMILSCFLSCHWRKQEMLPILTACHLQTLRQILTRHCNF